MINLSASGGSVVFTFTNSTYYLYGDGTITVPLNSLSLVTDNSNIATFKKAATNDIFVAAPVAEFGMSKAEIEAFYKENMVGSTGGGGGGGVTSGEVETMIDDALTDYDTKSEVNTKISTATGVVNGALTAHTADTNVHVTAAEKSTWNAKSDFSGSYNDLTDKPTIPTVPTSNTAFTNDAGYVTSGYVDSSVSGKQDTLVSGTNIKTINNQSLLGSGNITISGGSGSGTAAVELTQAEYDALVSGGTVDPTVFYIITDAPAIDLSGYAQTSAVTAEITAAVSGKVDTSTYNTYTAATNTALNGKQSTLVSGTNIKTINNESLLGSGNIVIQGGGGTVDQTIISGSTNAVAGGAVYDKFDEVEQVTAAALNTLNGKFGGLQLVKLTQQEYDDLAVKNNNTLYVII